MASKKYIRVRVPDSKDVDDFLKALRQKFTQQAQKGGSPFISISADKSYEDGRVFCVRTKGPTVAQQQLLQQYSM